jgi:O-antigen/teichoic acid export membrane protein
LRTATTAGLGPWVLALADQALVSGTRFLTTIVVGRFCGPEELGKYSLAFSLLVLAGCFQEALLTTPYAIVSKRLRTRSRATYAGAIARLHFVAAIGISALLVVFAGAAEVLHVEWATTMAPVLALTLSASLVAEFARRFSLAQLTVSWAVGLDAAIAALQLLLLLLLAQARWLNAQAALLVVGIACLLPSLVWWILAGTSQILPARVLTRYWGRNWSLGRWLVASQVMAALHGLVPAWLLAMVAGAHATGQFVACLNFALLANPLIFAVGNLLTPRAAQALVRGGPRCVRGVVLQVICYVAPLMAGFAFTLAVGGPPFIRWIYGNSFEGSENAAGIFGLIAIMWSVSAIAASALAALGRPRWGFVASCIGTLVTAAGIAILAPHWSVIGASLGLLLGSTTSAALHTWAFIRFSGGLWNERSVLRQPICNHQLAFQELTNA